MHLNHTLAVALGDAVSVSQVSHLIFYEKTGILQPPSVSKSNEISKFFWLGSGERRVAFGEVGGNKIPLKF